MAHVFVFTFINIPLFLEDAGLLPSLVRRSHIANYAPAVSLTRRLPESSMILGIYPNNLKMLFLREIKVLEARQRLEALVIPKRQALTRLQGLLAPLLHMAEMAFPQQLKTSIFKLIGYIHQ